MTVRALGWLAIGVFVVAFWLLAINGARALATGPECERGASSAIGPVTLVDGRLVGDTTPDVECLP